MLLDFLNAETVQVTEGDQLTWQTAIELAAKPLRQEGTIDGDYVKEMIQVVTDAGPYINIGDHVALAHSRPDGHVHKIGLSLLKTTSDVDLVNVDHPVKLWFVLAAVDSESHLAVIQELMTLLTDGNTLEQLLKATTTSDLLKIISDKMSA